MKFFSSLFLLFILTRLSAQFNLVPNYSFEDYNACPVSYSAFDYSSDTYVDDWYAGSSGTSDYFNSCASLATQVSVPVNLFSEDQPAHTGEAYAGFWTYFGGDFGPDAYREYAQIKLTDPMVAGTCYYVEFWCAPATQSDVSSSDHATTDAVGAYFDDEKVGDPFSYEVLDVVPQIENNGSGNYIDPPGDWTKVCGFFAAEGGEQWICIGNYHSGDIDVVAYEGGSVSPSSAVYLFLDDVLVTPLDSLIAAFLTDTVVCEPIVLSAPTCGDSYLWSTGETTQEITVSESGDYWLQIETSCGTVADTAEITFSTVPTITSATDIDVCFTDLPYEITAPDYSFYNWSTGEHTSSIIVDEEGAYYVSGFADCINYIDTFYLHVIDPLGLELDLGNDTLICAPQGWVLPLDAPSGFSDYAWSTGETTSGISVTEPGTYSVTITTSCETFTDEIEVTADRFYGSTIDLGPDIELCPPAGINNVVLTATAGLPNYTWNDGQQTNAITVSAAGTYWVITDLLCGPIGDSVRITLCNDLYLPNAFSPNGDGINDVLQLIIVDPSRLISFQIYDRWGELVFDGSAAAYTWDGKFNNKELPLGVYAYYILYTDDTGGRAVMKGNVTLVR